MFPISVLSTLDPLLRDVACLCLVDEIDILTCDLTEDSVILCFTSSDGAGWQREFPLAHPCITCSLREAVVPTLRALAAETDPPRNGVVLALPVAVEPLNVMPALEDLTADGEALEECVLTRCVHALDLSTAVEDLLHHVPLKELGLALFDEDERCTGEVLMSSVGYADIVATVGQGAAVSGLGAERGADLASDLVEHLRPLDTLRVEGLGALSRNLLTGGRHDSDTAIARIHPASTSAWGGPTTHGVWTLDLHSKRPLHPVRLAERIGELSIEGTCARGCFWLPSRPTAVCTWEVNGGSVSVGTAGEWEGEAFTHIIVTGVGDSATRTRIETSFREMLMTPAEMGHALDWIDVDDGLSAWFPVESPFS